MKILWLFSFLLAGAIFAGILIGVYNDPKPAPAPSAQMDTAASPVQDQEMIPVTQSEELVELAPERQLSMIRADPRPEINHTPLPGFARNDKFATARAQMVKDQITGRGISLPAVQSAMNNVQRHNFITTEHLAESYMDKPVDIGHGRIIETPFVIATVAEQLAADPRSRVLEVDAGSGYSSAVYSSVVKELYTIESSQIFTERARADLQRGGFTNNLFVRQAEMNQGWPEAAPFDAIVVNHVPGDLPDTLLNQLKSGGRIIFPVGDDGKLYILKKFGAQLALEKTMPVRPQPIPGNQVELSLIPAIRLAPVQNNP